MATANSALDWLVSERQQAVQSVQNLAGLTACSQLITLENGERYVLRRQTQRATDLGINYQQESQILTAIAPLALAPTPIYTDETASLLSWIDGTTPSKFRPDLLKKLAEKLVKLHHFPLQGGSSAEHFPILNLAERCQFLWDKLPAQKQATLPFSPPFAPIEPLTLTLCHHDIHLGNLVEQENKLFIIDWEYAAISDPALDLALCLHANAFSESEWQFFLQQYCEFEKFSKNSTAYIQKIAEYQPLIEVLNALWYAISDVENNSQKSHKKA